MSLKTAFEALKDGLKDLSSLEVRTFVGDISTIIKGQGLQVDVGQLVDAGVTSGDIKLKLYTRLDADGDSDHFFDSGDVDATILQSHVDAFRMGQEVRRGYLELFKTFAEDTILK